MIDKNALPTVLAVLKLLESNFMTTYDRYKKLNLNLVKRERYKEAKRIMSTLNEKEKKALRDVLLSMILMTSGNVESVRNPDAYSQIDAEPIGNIMTGHIKEIWSLSGGPKPDDYVPTKADYALAKKLLPVVSSIPGDRKKILDILKGRNLFGDPGKFSEEDDIQIADMLYRGLNSMSSQVMMLLFLVKEPSWDLSRSVSSSEDVSIAQAFMRKKEGWRVLFGIDNTDKRGFHVGDLSFYGTESEYLLSGILTIKNAELVIYIQDADKADMPYGYKMTVRNLGGKLSISIKDIGNFEGTEASNILLSMLQQKKSGNPKNPYIFRIGNKKYVYNNFQATTLVNASIQTN